MSNGDVKMEERRIPIYQVDAFTDQPFKGNPAAVCLLSDEFDDAQLQAISAEMNLSETAFLSSIEQGPLSEQRSFNLRWFTPTVEVPLCFEQFCRRVYLDWIVGWKVEEYSVAFFLSFQFSALGLVGYLTCRNADFTE